MSSDSNSLAFALAAHPGWMSVQFLHSVTGIEEDRLRSLLDDLVVQGKVSRSESGPSYWKWKDPDSAEVELRSLNDEARRALHRRLFEFIQTQEDLDGFAGLLARHAVLADMEKEAFLWNLRSGEILSASGHFDQAREYLQNARGFASDEARRARADQSLANLDFHLGRFWDAEISYDRVLQTCDPDRDPASWIGAAQSLAASQVEQGKYASALALLERCQKYRDVSGLETEQAVVTLHLTQVYLGMGMMREADASLRAVQTLLQQSSLAALAPYQQLLEGKLEILQGRLTVAFRILEEAARGFEGRGDLPGKLEVLLSISAPLMEHSLIREAQTLIDQVSSWEDLKNYPALEHAVHLRRLALGAFSGKWVRGDLALLSEDAFKHGRIEDWLQFWFHLSLAARRLKEFQNADNFLWKARGIVEQIAKGLEAGQGETFLKRPDVARIWRLTDRDIAALAQNQQVRAKRGLPASGPAEAATLAPPTPREK